MQPARRISRPEDLGRDRRWADLCLGVAGVLPLVMLAAWAMAASPDQRRTVETLADAWAACLLAFLAGVRRGLTFSEAGGGRWSELASMLVLFFLGVATLLLRSPAVAAAGCALVGVLDARAARRLQTPPYFTLLRPLQMTAGVLALAVIQACCA